MNKPQRKYLNRFLSALPEAEKNEYKTFSAGYFCADKENAKICSDLILSREKIATCSMKYWYERGLEPMPRQGHLQVVTDWNGQPTSIIETTEVFECRFLDVPPEFAVAEGEGDKSLKWWRKVHWEFFSRECIEQGIEPSQSMQLVLERFKVVYA